MPVTLKDISRAANVSTASVSKVLNGDYSRVGLETRERILRIAGELGYHPNLLARGLASRRFMVLGLILPDISNPYYGDLVRGVTDEAMHARYTVMIANTDDQEDRLIASIQMMAGYNAAGVLLVGGTNDPLASVALLSGLRVPHVCLENHVEGLSHCVYLNNYAGARKAVEHLIERGHRQIACISGFAVPDHERDKRTLGYRAALEAHGISVDPRLIAFGGFTFETGYEGTLRLLDSEVPFTAIACANDLIAMGAFRAIRERHLRIPEDISVVGFDDLPLATALEPPLTTVQQPAYDMGGAAARMLLARIDNHLLAQKTICFEPTLVKRNTVRILQA